MPNKSRRRARLDIESYQGDCGRSKRGLARAIRVVLQRARHPLPMSDIVARLRGRYRAFSVVTMVERLDERCVLTVLRLVRRGGIVGYTLPSKLEGYRRAGRLGEVRIWPVPDLRAILDDLNDDGR